MTFDPCALCGRLGHHPKECDWPTDTQDEPEPKPEPDPYDEFLIFD